MMKKMIFAGLSLLVLLTACSKEAEMSPLNSDSKNNIEFVNKNSKLPPPTKTYAISFCKDALGRFGYKCVKEDPKGLCNKYTPDCQPFENMIYKNCNTENMNCDFVKENYNTFYELYKQGVFAHPDFIIKDLQAHEN